MADMTGPVNVGSGWTVESQQEDTVIDSAGRVVRGYRVGFVTGHGVHGSVFLPDELHGPDAARALIAQRAAALDAVATLTAEG